MRYEVQPAVHPNKPGFHFVVVDLLVGDANESSRGAVVAFCNKRSTADLYAAQLNEKGYIEAD